MSSVAVVQAPAGSVGEALARRFEARRYRVLRVSGAAEAAGAERVDVLVTDAGAGADVAFGALDGGAARRALAVGFEGPVGLTQALWPLLVRSRGRVITVTAPRGVLASVRASGSSAAAHALVAWSRALSAAARGEGVHVLTAHAGAADAGRAADAVLRALDAGRHECWWPATLRAQAIVQALLPGSLGRRQAANR